MSERLRGTYDDDPNGSCYWPKDLPARRDVRYALELMAAGVGGSEIHKRTRLSTNRVLAIRTVPHMYDPYDDRVAIERALGGDRTVLPQLTYFERDTVRRLLVQRYRSEPYDPADFNTDGWNGPRHWLVTLAADWGVPQRRLSSMIVKIIARADAQVAA